MATEKEGMVNGSSSTSRVSSNFAPARTAPGVHSTPCRRFYFLLQISENLSLCDFPRSGTALWRERKAPAGPGTGGAQGARILRGAAPEAGTPHQGPSSRHPPAVWRRARRGLRLLGTRHVPASRHASARGTARAPGARRGALAAPLLRQTRGGWSSWGFGGRSSLT